MIKKAGVIGLSLIIGLLVIFPKVPVFALDITDLAVVRLVNEEREKNGLNHLCIDHRLTLAAKAKAADMINKEYWDHFHNGKSPWDWMEEFGYFYLDAGENLAIDFSEAETMHAAWMASSAHRANILNPVYKEIGIGIASGIFHNHKTIIVVQMFGNPDPQFEKNQEILAQGNIKGKKESQDREYEKIVNALVEIKIGSEIGREEGIRFSLVSIKTYLEQKIVSQIIDKIEQYFSAFADIK